MGTPRIILAAVLAVAGGVANAQAESLSGDRTIAFYNIHNKETLRIAYKQGGKYVPAAMKQINWILRDWRRDEPTEMDPKLIDILWEVHSELGSKEPIHIISGYRSPATNAMLRRTTGGQASKSRHMIGSAADVHFPDIPVQKLRYSALIRELGGVGYYPSSAIPFVHIDTGSVRAWPRLPRRELALLFPSGETQHRPAEGGSLSRGDVVRARASGGALVAELDAFHSERRHARQTLIAAARTVRAGPQLASLPQTSQGARTSEPALRLAAAAEPALPAPRLTEPPRLAERSPQKVAAPRPRYDRSSLFQLAALAGLAPSSHDPKSPPTHDAFDAGAGRPASATRPEAGRVEPVVAVSGATFDDEHPDELSYRPFPIAPYLTSTASIDDPSLTGLTAPDPARSLELLIADDSAPQFELRPGLAAAKALWSGTLDQGRLAVAGAPSEPASARRVATVRP